MSHVTCHMSNAYVDPWDMRNNFCFHVYAQMSLFVGENCNAYFLTAAPGPSNAYPNDSNNLYTLWFQIIRAPNGFK